MGGGGRWERRAWDSGLRTRLVRSEACISVKTCRTEEVGHLDAPRHPLLCGTLRRSARNLPPHRRTVSVVLWGPPAPPTLQFPCLWARPSRLSSGSSEGSGGNTYGGQLSEGSATLPGGHLQHLKPSRSSQAMGATTVTLWVEVRDGATRPPPSGHHDTKQVSKNVQCCCRETPWAAWNSAWKLIRGSER